MTLKILERVDGPFTVRSREYDMVYSQDFKFFWSLTNMKAPGERSVIRFSRAKFTLLRKDAWRSWVPGLSVKAEAKGL